MNTSKIARIRSDHGIKRIRKWINPPVLGAHKAKELAKDMRRIEAIIRKQGEVIASLKISHVRKTQLIASQEARLRATAKAKRRAETAIQSIVGVVAKATAKRAAT